MTDEPKFEKPATPEDKPKSGWIVTLGTAFAFVVLGAASALTGRKGPNSPKSGPK